MSKPKKVEELANRALATIEKAKPQLSSWVADKRRELGGCSRFESLVFLTFDLDSDNQRLVFAELSIDLADIEPLKRVMRRVG